MKNSIYLVLTLLICSTAHAALDFCIEDLEAFEKLTSTVKFKDRLPLLGKKRAARILASKMIMLSVNHIKRSHDGSYTNICEKAINRYSPLAKKRSKFIENAFYYAQQPFLDRIQGNLARSKMSNLHSHSASAELDVLNQNYQKVYQVLEKLKATKGLPQKLSLEIIV